MGTRALVTGANGFIGSHLVELLQDRGDQPFAMVRKTSNVDNLKGRKVDYRYADVSDVDSLREAMSGVEIVYHVAGAADCDGRREACRLPTAIVRMGRLGLRRDRRRLFARPHPPRQNSPTLARIAPGRRPNRR